MRVGSVDVRKVIGSRCAGMRYGGDSVRIVPRRVRGSSEEGVRISLVLAASTGESISAANAAAVVEMRTVAMGAVEASMEASGSVDVVGGTSMSGSERPKSAARKLRKKVSRVLDIIP